MSIVLWLLFLIIILPVTEILLFTLTMATMGIKYGMSRTLEICYGIIGAFLTFLAFRNLGWSIFSSLSGFCIFAAEAVLGITFLFLSITSVIIKKDREKWADKINAVLGGHLGKELKNHLFNNSYEYFVYPSHILFGENGNTYKLNFSDFGYADIPVDHTDIVCEWIRLNVTANPRAYRVQEVYVEHEVYDGGGSTGYTVTKKYNGDYDVSSYTNYGSSHTERQTIAYKLTKEPIKTTANKQNLKKW